MIGQQILNETNIELEMLYMMIIDRTIETIKIHHINYKATGNLPDYMKGYAGIKNDN